MVSAKINERLRELGMSQADLCRASGLRSGHVSELVNGKRGKRLSIDTVKALASGLQVTADFFYPNNTQLRVKPPKRHSRKRKEAVDYA